MNKLLKTAFKKTVPVLFGYLFLGIAFGLLLQKAGFHFIWAFFISLTVYAGSMQFVLISFLTGGTDLVTVAVMTLLINSRHLFYGLTFLEKFKAMGKSRLYMIFSLTDETYSLLCSVDAENPEEEKKLFRAIAILDQLYWILGSVLGAAIGDLITINTEGIEFSMTALFLVILLEQILHKENRLPAVIGAVSAVLFLILLGPDRFLLPALLLTCAGLFLFRTQVEGRRNG